MNYAFKFFTCINGIFSPKSISITFVIKDHLLLFFLPSFLLIYFFLIPTLFKFFLTLYYLYTLIIYIYLVFNDLLWQSQ